MFKILVMKIIVDLISIDYVRILFCSLPSQKKKENILKKTKKEYPYLNIYSER